VQRLAILRAHRRFERGGDFPSARRPPCDRSERPGPERTSSTRLVGAYELDLRGDAKCARERQRGDRSRADPPRAGEVHAARLEPDRAGPLVVERERRSTEALATDLVPLHLHAARRDELEAREGTPARGGAGARRREIAEDGEERRPRQEPPGGPVRREDLRANVVLLHADGGERIGRCTRDDVECGTSRRGEPRRGRQGEIGSDLLVVALPAAPADCVGTSEGRNIADRLTETPAGRPVEGVVGEAANDGDTSERLDRRPAERAHEPADAVQVDRPHRPHRDDHPARPELGARRRIARAHRQRDHVTGRADRLRTTGSTEPRHRLRGKPGTETVFTAEDHQSDGRPSLHQRIATQAKRLGDGRPGPGERDRENERGVDLAPGKKGHGRGERNRLDRLGVSGERSGRRGHPRHASCAPAEPGGRTGT